MPRLNTSITTEDISFSSPITSKSPSPLARSKSKLGLGRTTSKKWLSFFKKEEKISTPTNFRHVVHADSSGSTLSLPTTSIASTPMSSTTSVNVANIPDSKNTDLMRSLSTTSTNNFNYTAANTSTSTTESRLARLHDVEQAYYKNHTRSNSEWSNALSETYSEPFLESFELDADDDAISSINIESSSRNNKNSKHHESVLLAPLPDKDWFEREHQERQQDLVHAFSYCC